MDFKSFSPPLESRIYYVIMCLSVLINYSGGCVVQELMWVMSKYEVPYTILKHWKWHCFPE